MYVLQIYFKTENSTLFFQDMVKKKTHIRLQNHLGKQSPSKNIPLAN